MSKSKTYILNLNQPIIEEDGSDNKDLSFGQALGHIMFYTNIGGKKESYVLGKALRSGDKIEVTSGQLQILKQAINSTTAFVGNLVPGQLLEYIDTVEPVDEESQKVDKKKDKSKK